MNSTPPTHIVPDDEGGHEHQPESKRCEQRITNHARPIKDKSGVEVYVRAASPYTAASSVPESADPARPAGTAAAATSGSPCAANDTRCRRDTTPAAGAAPTSATTASTAAARTASTSTSAEVTSAIA